MFLQDTGCSRLVRFQLEPTQNFYDQTSFFTKPGQIVGKPGQKSCGFLIKIH